jgi:hypothetical protein
LFPESGATTGVLLVETLNFEVATFEVTVVSLWSWDIEIVQQYFDTVSSAVSLNFKDLDDSSELDHTIQTVIVTASRVRVEVYCLHIIRVRRLWNHD